MAIRCHSWLIMLKKMVWTCRCLSETEGGYRADWGPHSTSKPQPNSEAALSLYNQLQRVDRRSSTELTKTGESDCGDGLLRVRGIASWRGDGDMSAEIPSACGDAGTRKGILDEQVNTVEKLTSSYFAHPQYRPTSHRRAHNRQVLDVFSNDQHHNRER
jgi:hypothetical protein